MHSQSQKAKDLPRVGGVVSSIGNRLDADPPARLLPRLLLRPIRRCAATSIDGDTGKRVLRNHAKSLQGGTGLPCGLDRLRRDVRRVGNRRPGGFGDDREMFAQGVPASIPTPPASALGFLLCGLALIAVGYWFPHVTLLFGTVAMSLAVVVAGESVFKIGPRMEHHIALSLGALDWDGLSPNTAVVLLLGGAALLLRHKSRWFESRLHVIAIVGSMIFGIGIAGCVGYTGQESDLTYACHL